MKNFIKAIKEINRTLNFLMFFETMLNTTIFFLLLYFLLSLINLYPILAIIPAVIYFAVRLYVNSKSDKRVVVENKYIPLKEKLRTAADNIKQDNPVVNELQDEVLHDLKHVGISSFIKTKRVSYKIFSIILLSFAIVFATTLNLYVVDFSQFLSGIPGIFGDILGNADSRRADNTVLGELNESNDIYGGQQACWANCVNPTKKELKDISEKAKISLNELKKVLDEEERPKVSDLENYSLIIVRAPVIEDEEISTTPVSIFISKNKNNIITIASNIEK